MMTLPKFNNQNISIADLRKEQTRLHEQADKMLRVNGLSDIFKKYGQVLPIGGSYGYGLMVYPDLDIDIINDKYIKHDAVKLASDLMDAEFVRKVSYVDNVAFKAKKAGMPRGYWLGIEVPFEGEKWGIDVWLKSSISAQEFEANNVHYKQKLSNISLHQIDAILMIKYHLIRLGKYGTPGFMSYNVYDAVIDKGVLSIQDFI